MAKAHWNLMQSSRMNAPWDELPEDHWIKIAQRILVDDLLEALASAGYKIVPADWIMCVRVGDDVRLPGFDPDDYPLDNDSAVSLAKVLG